MKKIFIYKIIFLTSFLYSQCEEFNQTQCNSDIACEWFEDIDSYNCSNFSSESQCNQYSQYGCSWEWSWGGWMNHGSTCAGGYFQVDNGFCEEILMPECSEMNESNCNSNIDCEWIEDIEFGSCSSIAWQICDDYPGCYVDSEPGWYDSSGPYCTGGSYQIDNSYCQDFMMPECSGMNLLECNQNDSCEWVEDIEYGNCWSLNENQCDSNPNCYYDCGMYHGSCAGCCWGDCLGGSYVESDNSYCQDSSDNNSGNCPESDMFECNDGGCVFFERVCNGIEDCEDGSDEVDCAECSDMNEYACNEDETCNWVVDINSYNCIELSDNQCMNHDVCWLQQGECLQWGSWYTWMCYEYDYSCAGGVYETDDSYCEEFQNNFLLGDYNLDGIINVLDVIQTIDLILTGNIYDEIVDMNQDSIINILDVIGLIDLILES